MNATQKARRVDALNTGNENRRRLCEMIAHREADNEDLRVENARLRQIVKDYEQCSMHADCSMCEYDGKLSTHCPLSPCFPDVDELHKLGVEVD